MESLKQQILDFIQEGYLDRESDPIIEYLIDINKTSFVSFESQPHSIIRCNNDVFMQRAYINGIYPKDKISKLCQYLPKGIVLSETRLDNNGDVLYVYGRNDYETPLVSRLEVYHPEIPDVCYIPELYPMFLNTVQNEVRWVRGYSGNVIKPQSRDYIKDFLFDFSSELTNDIIRDYSLVQVWSENIEDLLFPILLNCLIKVERENNLDRIKLVHNNQLLEHTEAYHHNKLECDLLLNFPMKL